MYDKGKILTGLVIFFGILSFPFWYTVGQGNAGYEPVLEKAIKGEDCVIEAQEMKAKHMEILNVWRDEVVREGKREQINVGGLMYDKSLTNTCLDCHPNKDKFCDQCHNFLGVKPYCWGCHVNPKEIE
jgi:hypothetical protein